jgi:transcription initiation factor TFIIIB Brf1 subunit/transcription initiation factor TFIIB
MNILEKQNCPECKSTLVDDMQNGEIICSGCGVVVDDQIADFGPETISSKLKLRRQDEASKSNRTNNLFPTRFGNNY